MRVEGLEPPRDHAHQVPNLKSAIPGCPKESLEALQRKGFAASGQPVIPSNPSLFWPVGLQLGCSFWSVSACSGATRRYSVILADQHIIEVFRGLDLNGHGRRRGEGPRP